MFSSIFKRFLARGVILKTLYIAILILGIAASVFATGDTITDFIAYAEDQQAVLKWNVASEAGLTKYVVQRSFDGNVFYDVVTINPIGDYQSYSYIDSDLFKGNSRTYYYRITALFIGGVSQCSDINQVTLHSSSVARTWGSIKAMFR